MIKKNSLIFTLILTFALASFSCGSNKSEAAEVDAEDASIGIPLMKFSEDSAFSYLRRQVEFGPRSPGSEAHRKCREWLAAELKRQGAEVTLQKGEVTTADGKKMPAYNILGSYNPQSSSRLLLLAHYDTRPWGDADADEANHSRPIDGANDGASGVGVLLEIARALNARNPGQGIDILFVDMEDSGSHEDEDSWALGARYFAQNASKTGYRPDQAILLDMVGGKGAVFSREYFSQQAAPELISEIWETAAKSGFAERFSQRMGGAITDDHLELIKEGIPAIDIIEFNPDSPTGFPTTWHTMDDNLSNIDTETLKAVGQTLLNYIYGFKE